MHFAIEPQAHFPLAMDEPELLDDEQMSFKVLLTVKEKSYARCMNGC